MPTVALVWTFLAFVWGSTWVVIKVGLADLPPFTFAGIRFTLAAAVLFVVLFVRGAPLPRGRGQWGLLAVAAVLSISLEYGIVFWAQQHVAAGMAAVLTAMIPVFVMLIAHWSLPDEPITRRKVVGVLCGLAGVTVIFSDQLMSVGSLALLGSIALVFGAATTAHAQVLIKKHGGRIDPMVMAAWQMALGAVPLLAVGLWLEGNPLAFRWTGTATASLLYLALVGSSAAFFAMYWLYAHMNVTKVMSVIFVNPLVAVLLGWMVLGEVLSWRAAVGGMSILIGLGLVLWAPDVFRRKARVAGSG